MHTDPLHDPHRRHVEPGSQRHDLGQTGRPEAETKRLASGFGGIAVAPREAVEAPAHFHARREMRLEILICQAGKAEEGGIFAPLHRPQAKATLVETSFNAIDEGVAFGAGQGTQEVTHHLRIGVETGERLAVGVPPASQDQAVGGQRCVEIARHRIAPRILVAAQRPAAARTARRSASWSA